ncbi:hypothetical protein CEXT_32961 [Caerostris extrusa]|uniref:Uncharacterized protein n=1 Tax=Caerostris extrusa TaxID=172846 RepID=A0AAV4SZG3_CAEEX|nr:hypothetical protein CEXT_32961 [Caerostris extrusa]
MVLFQKGTSKLKISGKKFLLPPLRVAELLFASLESFKQPSLIFGSRFGLPTVLELTSAITYQRGKSTLKECKLSFRILKMVSMKMALSVMYVVFENKMASF